MNTTFYYDAKGNKVPSVPKDVPQEVYLSEFGCRHCLFLGCECTAGSRFSPAKAYDGQPSCGAYAYCD